MKYFCFFEHNIHCGFSWVESHPVIVGVITTVFISAFWLSRFLKQKRAEAFFGFYSRLLLQIKNIRIWLEQKKLLSIDDEKDGNIYTLLYPQDAQKIICPKFNALKLGITELNELTLLVSTLKETLLDSENNVYPKLSNKTLWYKSQQILFNFCNFIEFESMRGKIDHEKNESYEHITKCKELIDSMNYIQVAIETEEY